MLVNSYSGLASFLGLAGTITGRKKLQKAVYLAKELGFPGLDERFDYHWFGPYSEGLAAEVGELVLLGAVSEDEYRTPGGYPTYSYTLTDRARTLFAEKIKAVSRYQDGVRMLLQYDPRFLELAATLHFFLRSGYAPEEATREVQVRKAEQDYSRDECEKAVGFLKELKRAFQVD